MSMSMTTILAPMLFGDKGAAALGPALVVARQMNAHVVGLLVRPSPMQAAPFVYPPFPVAYVVETSEAFKKKSEDRAQELRNEFDRICAAQETRIILPSEHDPEKGASASWRDEAGPLPFAYAQHARLADLTVMAAPGDDPSVEEMAYAEELVFQSGGPVLFAPERMTEFPENAVVAWNGGLEAARAMKAAIPALRKAREVVVLTIGEIAPGAPSPEAAADFLQMHGVRAVHDQFEPGEKRAEDSLMAAAARRKAGLIVMGAYSHNRWREAILGGFTRHFLRQNDIAVLMAH